jgi:hypothetical protein
MATTNEIRERIQQADAARSRRRLAAAQRVGELADRRTKLAAQLKEIDAELGEVLAENEDVISVPELAAVTDLSAADLSHWLGRRKPSRTKRKRPAGGGTDAKTPTHHALVPASVAPRAETAPARIPEPVT